MPDAVDFILQAAEESQSRFSELDKERAEAESAQDMFNTQAQAGLEAALKDVEKAKRITAVQAASQAQALSEMQGATARLNELNNMPGIADRVIGPIASLFDPSFDRGKLASRIRNAQTKLDIADSRAAIERKEIEHRQQRRALELKQAANRQLSEEQDVSNIQARLDDARKAASDLTQLQQVFLSQASVEEQEQAVATGFVTKRQVERAQRRERAAELALSQGEFQETLRQLNRLGDDELQSLAASEGPRSELAKSELTRRANRDANALAVQRAQLEYEIEAADPAKLGQMLSGGTITQRQFDREMDRRDMQEMSKEQVRLSLQEGRQASFEKARIRNLRYTPISTLDGWIEEATATGAIEVAPGVQYSLEELVEVRQGKTDAVMGSALAEMQSASAAASLQSVSGQAARVTNNAVSTDPAATFEVIAADPNASPAVRAQANAAAQVEQLIATGTMRPAEEARMRSMVADGMSAATAAESEARAALLPKTQQSAYMQYARSGEVQERGSAISSTATAVASGQRTGSEYWDRVLDDSSAALATMRAEDPRLAAVGGTAEPETLVATVYADPDRRQTILQGFYNQATVDIYKRTAVQLGDEQLTAMLGNPGSDIHVNGVLDTVRMHRFLDERPAGITSDQFLNQAKTVARDFAQTELPPAGRHGHVQAALNNLLFQNQVSQFFVMQFDRQIFADQKELARQRTADEAARMTPQFPEAAP